MTVIRFFFVFIALSFCEIFRVFAQDFQRIALHPEAPQSAISNIIQDKRGFLWFADENGLHRYDGRNFATYPIATDKSSLENAVSAMTLDSNGTLYLANRTHLFTFDRRQERVIPCQTDTLLTGNIVVILGNSTPKAHEICLVRQDGIEFFPSGKIFPYPQSRINTALQDNFGTIWLGTDKGLAKFHSSLAAITAAESNFEGETVSLAQGEYTPNSSSILAGTSSGKCYSLSIARGANLNGTLTRATPLVQGKERILAILQERSGQVWCATAGGGLYLISKDQTTVRRFTDEFAGGRFFTSIFEDRQGIIWLGATDGSIYKLDRSIRKFTPFKPDISLLPNKQPFLTLCIFEDSEGVIWIGTEQGLMSYSSQNSTTKTNSHASSTIKQKPSWELFQHNKADKTSLSANTVSCIYEDRGQRLWIGTTAGGLNLFDRKSKRFRHFRHNPKDSTSISSDNISCIYEDSRGRIWVGTWINGLNLFDAATETFLHYRSNPQKISTLSSNSISALTEDRFIADGTLWIGTYEDGLNAFHPTIQAFTRHLHNPANPRSLSSNAVSGVFEHNDGSIWITSDAGLDKFDRRSQVFTRYGEQHGLPNEVLSAVLGDNDGNLWIMGSSTITKFSPKTEKAHYYDVSDGLGTSLTRNDAEPEQFSSRAYARGRDGSIYFGTSSGFVRFHPDSVRDNSYKPPVVLTVLKKFNAVAVLPVSITEADTIEISYTDNFITFEFAALNYSSPEKNRFRYTLEGFDKAWIDAGSKTEAIYTNLDGGVYRFRVVASNNDGIWNEEGCALTVIVRPPFWRTSWFYAAVGIAVVGGSYGGFRLRVKRLRKRNEELKRLVEERTAQLTASMRDLEQQKLHTEERSQEVERLNAVLNAHNTELAEQTRTAQLEMLRYQLNPHFLFNALISISDLVYEDAKHAARTLQTLMSYLRYALQPAGLPTVLLSEEIKAVESYLEIEKVRFEERLRIMIAIAEDADDFYVPGFMLQPLVENAIKYGMRTSPMPLEIVIRAVMTEGNLHLEVSNSGSLTIPDHTPKPEGTGTGTRNIQERLQVLFPDRHEFALLEENGKVIARIILRNA